MTESMSIEQLIKIILGVLVVVAVVLALYFFFKEKVIDFFRNFGGGKDNFILYLLG